MSIEEKAKVYEEALERARKFYNDCVKGDNPIQAQRYVDIFPELADSEDERIRKALLNEFIHLQSNGYYKFAGLEGEEIIAYLEKQKEQKPVEIHIDNPNIQKFDSDVKVTTSDSSADGKELLYVSNKSYDIGFRDGVASVKPAEWSEEDEAMLNRIVDVVEDYQVDDCYEKEIDWLKSLRPQPHWKPSEEQMSILAKVFAGCELKTPERDSMVDLFYNLKRMI